MGVYSLATRDVDSKEIMDAKKALRAEAQRVRDCPYCDEGWRRVERGVTRCDCMEQYQKAWSVLANLDTDFFVEDTFASLSKASRAATATAPPMPDERFALMKRWAIACSTGAVTLDLLDEVDAAVEADPHGRPKDGWHDVYRTFSERLDGERYVEEVTA